MLHDMWPQYDICVVRQHGRVYGPCTRLCTGHVYCRVHGPCTYTAVNGRVHGRIHVYTTRVRAVYIDGRVFTARTWRWTRCVYTAVYTTGHQKGLLAGLLGRWDRLRTMSLNVVDASSPTIRSVLANVNCYCPSVCRLSVCRL